MGSKEYHVHDSKDSSNRGLRPQAQQLQLQTLLRELRKAEKKLKDFCLIDTRSIEIKVGCTLINPYLYTKTTLEMDGTLKIALCDLMNTPTPNSCKL